MTPEEKGKELILKDISGRLPYCPTVQISLFRNDGRKSDIDLDPRVTENIWELIDKYHALPYLRPMSSMTEEEKEEYHTIIMQSQDCSFENGESATTMVNDWLLSKHFDVRGLIPKGLALEAPENMYKIK